MIIIGVLVKFDNFQQFATLKSSPSALVVSIQEIGNKANCYFVIVDAAYEGLRKRTFGAMLVLLATHLPFLIGIVFMYRKLGIKPPKSSFKDVKEENECASDLDTYSN